MKYSKFSFVLIVLSALSSCIQITNENKAVNGSNSEGGNTYSQESYAYKNNEYSSSTVETTSSRESNSAAPASFYMTGTAAGDPCSIQFDFNTGRGQYIQHLNSGKETKRQLRLSSYDGSRLVLDAYNSRGEQVSSFKGTMSSNGNRYSGKITNNKGGSINFDVSR
ncbi:MAG: hypothetical protein IK073_06800 [Paludibacteraceae bacterium]|nr:hypothetical protein [Paludibacteraceae bacterium]